jgi:hypothetical protein
MKIKLRQFVSRASFCDDHPLSPRISLSSEIFLYKNCSRSRHNLHFGFGNDLSAWVLNKISDQQCWSNISTIHTFPNIPALLLKTHYVNYTGPGYSEKFELGIFRKKVENKIRFFFSKIYTKQYTHRPGH